MGKATWFKALSIITMTVLAVSSAHAAPVLVDFAVDAASVSPNWNAAPEGATTTVNNLIDTDGAATGISLTHTGFYDDSDNNTCTTSPTGDAAIFDGCSQYSVYGCTSTWMGNIFPQAAVTLSGLNTTSTYDLVFFASRMGPSDNRETEYVVTGASSLGSFYLDSVNNTSNVVSVLGVTPDAGGNITIDVDPGPNNNNGYGFFYLSAMQIEENAVPEPATMSIFALSGLLISVRKRRR